MATTIDVDGHKCTRQGDVITLFDRNTGATYEFQVWDGTCWKLGARADKRRQVQQATALYAMLRSKAQEYHDMLNV